MEEIKQWLNGPRDYDTGAALVVKYHPNTLLHQVFKAAKTPYKMGRLPEVLRELLQNGPVAAPGAQDSPVIQKTDEPTQTEPVPENWHKMQVGVPGVLAAVSDKWGNPDDPVLTAMRLEWVALFARMNLLTNTLYDVAKAGETDKAKKVEAGKMAHEILALETQIGEIYQNRDTYIATGQVPVKNKLPDDLVTDPKKWPTALASAQRRLRDYKGQLKKEPGNAKTKALVAKWQDRVKHYQTLLNG